MYTPMQEEQFREELARRRVMQVILAIIIVPIGFVVVFLKYAHEKSFFGYSVTTVRIVGCLVIVALAVLAANLWRCPGCKARLGSQFRPETCPNCNAKLRNGSVSARER